MKGIFTLHNADDLFRKLERDYARLKSSPHDVDAAIDFFFTAYHLLEWHYRGKGKELEKGCALLQILSHIANGAKHFELQAERHNSVVDSGLKGGPFGPAGFDPEVFDVGSLTITLQGKAAECFGDNVSVQEFAQKVLEYWSKVFKA